MGNVPSPPYALEDRKLQWDSEKNNLKNRFAPTPAGDMLRQK
jgi:hypothetical protein